MTLYSFKDTAGRDWLITLNYATIKRVHAETSLDLRKLVDGDEKNPLEPCYEFVSDPLAFGPALYTILKPDLEKKSISLEAFLESLDGDAAYAAGQAFVRAYVDFFHAAKKAALHKLIDKSAEMWAAGTKVATTKMGEIDVGVITKKLEAEIDAHVAKLLNSSSGTVPASSESTPVPSLSVSS